MSFFNDETSREKHLRRGLSSLVSGCGSAAGLTAIFLSAIPFVGWVALLVVASIATVSSLAYGVFSFFKAYKGKHEPNEAYLETIHSG